MVTKRSFRYSLDLIERLKVVGTSTLQIVHKHWVNSGLVDKESCRDSGWVENRAVGTEEFIKHSDEESINANPSAK